MTRNILLIIGSALLGAMIASAVWFAISQPNCEDFTAHLEELQATTNVVVTLCESEEALLPKSGMWVMPHEHAKDEALTIEYGLAIDLVIETQDKRAREVANHLLRHPLLKDQERSTIEDCLASIESARSGLKNRRQRVYNDLLAEVQLRSTDRESFTFFRVHPDELGEIKFKVEPRAPGSHLDASSR